MPVDLKLLSVEDSLKEKHLNSLKQQSQAELQKFKKLDYKKVVMSEMSDLLPEYQKSQYDQTALCVVNFLQSEVKALLRKAPEETPQSDTNLLSETVTNELDSTMQQHSDESDAESDSDDNENLQNLNDSTTKLKEVVSKEPNPPKLTRKSKSESSKYVKCCYIRIRNEIL